MKPTIPAKKKHLSAKQRTLLESRKRISCYTIEIIEQRLLDGIPPRSEAWKDMRDALNRCADELFEINQATIVELKKGGAL